MITAYKKQHNVKDPPDASSYGLWLDPSSVQECKISCPVCSGCMDEKLSVLVPETLNHEEFPLHIYTAGTTTTHL